jgi:antitoxin component YwqK of YwqJK toxin-antitoxin module
MKKYFLNFVFNSLLAVAFLSVCFFVSSCSKKQNDGKISLVKKNGLLYKSGSSTPYTGREKAKVSGKIIEYEVVNGIKNGEMKISYTEGKPQIVGKMVNNKNEGLWKYYYDNSQMESEGNYKNDIPEGEWTWFYSDGKVREKGSYISGKKEGKWITYEGNGKPVVEKKFKNGELVTK